MAALALMRPSSEFRVATVGRGSPVGHIVRYPNVPAGITETFSAYAAAVDEMLQPPSCGMGKLRKVPPGIGPPPAPTIPSLAPNPFSPAGGAITRAAARPAPLLGG